MEFFAWADRIMATNPKGKKDVKLKYQGISDILRVRGIILLRIKQGLKSVSRVP